MTIEKAIEILKDFLPPEYSALDTDEEFAIKLGVEALSVILSIRKGSDVPARVPLPGETKERG